MRKPSEYMTEYFIEDIFPAFSNTIKAERTKVEYFSAICLYCDFMQKDFLEQTMNDALDYTMSLTAKISDGKFSKTTLVTRISCYRKLEEFIRDFYGEDMCKRCWAKIQMPSLDSSISKDRIPSVEDIDILLDNAKSEGFMWYVIISLVVKCALTASELVNIRRDNFINEHGEVYIYLADKGRPVNFQEKRYMKMPKDMRDLFLSYIVTVPKDSDVIFFNNAGRPLTLKNIDDALKRMYAGYKKKYTIKDIRSRGILEMLASTDDPQAVGEYVGLSQLRMKSFVEAAGLVDDKHTVADLNNIIIKPYER